MKPYIIMNEGKKIVIVLDPPHMIKLVRNCLVAEKQIVRNHKVISSRFFEYLVSHKSDPNIQLHKLSYTHIEWEKNKISVRIADQTLSESTANAMQILCDQKNHLFITCSETIHFIRNFNKLFDIFNAEHKNSENKFKIGLNESNAQEVFEFLNYMISYIKTLTIRRINILESNRSTGFIGFIINIESLKIMYHELILTKKLPIILLFYLGQDLLESLFPRIRGYLGGNDNPSTTQLIGSVRRIMIPNEFKASEHANWEDHLNILHVPSTTKKT